MAGSAHGPGLSTVCECKETSTMLFSSSSCSKSRKLHGSASLVAFELSDWISKTTLKVSVVHLHGMVQASGSPPKTYPSKRKNLCQINKFAFNTVVPRNEKMWRTSLTGWTFFSSACHHSFGDPMLPELATPPCCMFSMERYPSLMGTF